jgi:Mlc titration factor MtfA (ptsG expression regulator)
MPILLVVIACALFVWWTLSRPSRTQRRRRRIRSQPFPPSWDRILRRRVPLAATLPRALQRELKEHILVFLAEKPFIGCAGLRVNDEMRVTIAAQACLLLLRRGSRRYFENLRQILVYPGAFLVSHLRPDPAGVLHDHRSALAGESWHEGQVILSWEDVLEGAAVEDDGRNVVIHEFAHQLDQEHGAANGAPGLPSRRRYETWSAALGRAFAHTRWEVQTMQPTLLGEYAASSPAEFFAVACEFFFERPADLRAVFPQVYEELARYFRVDPAQWHVTG